MPLNGILLHQCQTESGSFQVGTRAPISDKEILGKYHLALDTSPGLLATKVINRDYQKFRKTRSLAKPELLANRR